MKINYKNAQDRKHFIDSIVFFYENNEKVTKDIIKFAFNMNESLGRSIFALISKAKNINDDSSAKIILDRVTESYGINGNRKILFEELTEAILKSNDSKKERLRKNLEYIIPKLMEIKDINKEKEVIYTEKKHLEKKINTLNSKFNKLDDEIEFLKLQIKSEIDMELKELITE